MVVDDEGRILMDAAPRQVFARVEELRAVELDVPQPTELCHLLRKAGVRWPEDVLTVEECVSALSLLL